MSKRSVFTSITALPEHVSRETAVTLLHDHVGMIWMNPLVVRMEPSTPPPNATPEEVKVMSWYAITDEIVYVPGTKVKGETSYKAGFYDLPRGLQTHVFAPAGVDIKTKWTVGGSLPGEEKESVELGLNAPREGLYIREDADLRCSVFVMNFVKRNLKKGHIVLCERLIQKASFADEDRRAQMGRESVVSTEADSILRRWDHLYNPSTATALDGLSAVSAWDTPVDNTCACEGVSHEPSCASYMPFGQLRQPSCQEAQSQTQRSSLQQPSVHTLPDQHVEHQQQIDRAQTAFPPTETHSCTCSGSAHSLGCSQYMGSVSSPPRPKSTGPEILQRLHEGQQQQPFQLSMPGDADREALSAYPRTNPYSFSKPLSPRAGILDSFSGHTFRPQKPGEQAELPADMAQIAVDDPYSAVDLRPEPLLIRTQHGHAVVMELDGEADLARQYWSQRVGEPEGMARG